MVMALALVALLSAAVVSVFFGQSLGLLTLLVAPAAGSLAAMLLALTVVAMQPPPTIYSEPLLRRK